MCIFADTVWCVRFQCFAFLTVYTWIIGVPCYFLYWKYVIFCTTFIWSQPGCLDRVVKGHRIRAMSSLSRNKHWYGGRITPHRDRLFYLLAVQKDNFMNLLLIAIFLASGNQVMVPIWQCDFHTDLGYLCQCSHVVQIIENWLKYIHFPLG